MLLALPQLPRGAGPDLSPNAKGVFNFTVTVSGWRANWDMSTIALAVPPRTRHHILVWLSGQGPRNLSSRGALFELTSTSSLPHQLSAGLQRDNLGGNVTLQQVRSPAQLSTFVVSEIYFGRALLYHDVDFSTLDITSSLPSFVR
ncbi:hypothetical protein PCL_10548 [Purpureocillium lilacinum]|uniref:Uncharacterized protein n=1 Tax=Purpureocillium lilacinum TaxID=33203 RepID=A0A2U3DQ25_PURLI|nr:hypothetical protein PCL_10548 [Purpureocillium lilacinum]